VANGASVTELSASTGALVRVIRGANYGISGPEGIALSGTHVWVANGASVTELSASTGALVRVIRCPSYGFDGPEGITSDGSHVWVANFDGASVTEFPAS
jgi:uncharacterized protein YerC